MPPLRAKILRYLYTIIYYLAVPALLLRIGWRSLRYDRGYSVRWQQRFGWIPAVDGKTIWLHAVSMGETLAAVPLVNALLARYPDYRLVITSTTPTGAAQAAKHFGNRVIALYTPYDLPGAVHRFLRGVHPALGIILETELWPNLIKACARDKVPLLLANARLSERSSRGYRKIAPLVAEMLNSFSVVAAQSKQNGERFLSLGLEKQRLHIAGNIKFDIQLPPNLNERALELRAQWGKDRPVWVAASTHEGEEPLILEAYAHIRAALPATLLILVPRHPQRFSKVAQLCREKYVTALRSENERVTAETAILLGDTIGELLLFYAASDVAFVGGSFVPIGGHNLIEPAILARPVLTGPHLHHFVQVSQQLVEAGGAEIVKDAETLSATVVALLSDADRRKDMGQNAQAAVMANTGALSRHLALIESYL